MRQLEQVWGHKEGVLLWQNFSWTRGTKQFLSFAFPFLCSVYWTLQFKSSQMHTNGQNSTIWSTKYLLIGSKRVECMYKYICMLIRQWLLNNQVVSIYLYCLECQILARWWMVRCNETGRTKPNKHKTLHKDTAKVSTVFPIELFKLEKCTLWLNTIRWKIPHLYELACLNFGDKIN